MSAHKRTGPEDDAGDIEPLSGQPIEEAEKNLSRHTTKDSSPPVEEQWRTSVQNDSNMPSSGDQRQRGEQGKE